MEVFDTHIHSEGRSVEDLEEMAKNGIKMALTCAFYPIQPRFPETLIDHFRKLKEYEVERGKVAGMKVYPAMGIHPRCIPPRYERVLEEMDDCTAFGEIGLESASDIEVEVFREQLKLAKKLDVPCVIHTPRRNKLDVTLKILKILEGLEFPEDLAIVDHATYETVGYILDRGFYAGLTVQVGKLSVEEFVKIVEDFGFERFVVNSDIGFDKGDKLSTVKAVRALEETFDKRDVERVAFKNALKVFTRTSRPE